MIRSGVASVTFRKLKPERVIQLAMEAGVSAIEWGGDIHVPHGDIKAASQVGAMTRDAGIIVSSYGSYYRALDSRSVRPAFESVLDTAIALDAPLIRIWAGDKSPDIANSQYRQAVAADIRNATEIAEGEGIGVALEFHPNTLTETIESTLALLVEVAHPNLSTYWQKPDQGTPADQIRRFNKLLSHVSNIHVSQFMMKNQLKYYCALSEGDSEWLSLLKRISRLGGNHYAIIEFVEGDDPQSFLRDAAILNNWLNRITSE